MNPQYAYQGVNRSFGIRTKRRSLRVVVDAEVFLKQSEVQLFRATLSDLSDSGFRVVCYSLLDPDRPVFIRLPGVQVLQAGIRWVDHQDYGCEFANRLSSDVLENLTAILTGA